MVTLAKLRPKPVKTVNAGFPYVNHKKSGRLSFESYSHSPPTISPLVFIFNRRSTSYMSDSRWRGPASARGRPGSPRIGIAAMVRPIFIFPSKSNDTITCAQAQPVYK
ncbi:hypothetical protein F444_07387 [Phytophthora nicotianae P1976]|uniref:Uncharacterized protein n=1 Tax=Phytophthora nicotianae P1976 TaxID=1317066 RepID=A0A081AEU0_PHYNI|nr:hypothetical protein F444_07387 [Phytophthora nicotianae P1976]